MSLLRKMKTPCIDLVREAKRLGAKFYRYEDTGKWCILNARSNSNLWKMQFESIQNAAKAFLIVYWKRNQAICREWHAYNHEAEKEGKTRVSFSTFEKWVNEGFLSEVIKKKITA